VPCSQNFTTENPGKHISFFCRIATIVSTCIHGPQH
jgi:hypothetical protein